LEQEKIGRVWRDTKAEGYPRLWSAPAYLQFDIRHVVEDYALKGWITARLTFE